VAEATLVYGTFFVTVVVLVVAVGTVVVITVFATIL
jgi:hypothetical protein